MVKLIENGRMPSAIFAGCDETGFGALMATPEFGLSAPENVSIIEIDEHRMSWLLGLTTMAQSVAGQGAFAATLLMDRLHRSGLPNPPPAGPQLNPLLETKQVERKSTRPPNRMKQMNQMTPAA
jgi:DNA-binding LacI/PurR family transcriptional regulator